MTSRRWIPPLVVALIVLFATLLLLRVAGNAARERDAIEPGATVARDESSADVPAPRRAATAERAVQAPVEGRSSRPPGPLRGRVTRPDGRPVDDVRVLLRDGDEILEARSDRDGRFDFPELLQPSTLTVEKADWLRVSAGQFEWMREGRWRDLEVVMTPTATLEVALVDRDGAPAHRVGVAVGVSPCERVTDRTITIDRQSGRPSDAGVVGPWRVPADMRLEVFVGSERFEWLDRNSNELVADAIAAEALVLEAGETRRVLVTGWESGWIEGVVLFADGTPANRAAVEGVVLEPEGERGLHQRITDDQGRFAFGWSSRRMASRVLLCAFAGESDAGLRFVGGSIEVPDTLVGASREVDLDEGGRGPTGLTLRLGPLSAIGGQVVDKLGSPVPVFVRAVPRAALRTVDPLPTGQPNRAPRFREDPDGRFRFAGVPEGEYDLAVTPKGGSTFVHGPVRAGDTDLVIATPRPSAALDVVIDSAHGVRSVDLRIARVDPLPGVRFDAPAPSERPAEGSRAEELRGWPAADVNNGFRDGVGLVTVTKRRSFESTTRLELHPGLYRIGASVQGEDRSLFPVGTELLSIEAGESRVVLHPPSIGSLDGRMAEDSDWSSTTCVALAVPDGPLLPLRDAAGETREVRGLSAAGAFRFFRVPEGRFELLVGTEAELRAGRPRLRRAVEVEAGRTTTVEL